MTKQYIFSQNFVGAYCIRPENVVDTLCATSVVKENIVTVPVGAGLKPAPTTTMTYTPPRPSPKGREKFSSFGGVRGGVMLLAFCLLLVAGSAVYAQHPPLGGGSGSYTDPYQISDSSHLRELADYVNAGNGDNPSGMYYILVNDIDLGGYTNWKPIGIYYNDDWDYHFWGYFDGNGKVIQNLTINRPTENCIGLFGYVNRGNVNNIGLENCNIVGQDVVGGLIGYSDYVFDLSNCYVTGNVRGRTCVGGLIGFGDASYISDSYVIGSINGNNGTGGLVGRIVDAYISDSYFTGDVNGSSDYVGGLVGYGDYTSIFNSYVIGNVNGNRSRVGGLIGYSSGSATISNCYTTSNVSGNGEMVGGLVGENYFYSNIFGCYTTGSVNGNSNNVGGLVGQNYSANISNCYAAGSVSGRGESVGGLVGINTDASISNCYATGNVNGRGEGVGGLVGFNGNSSVSNCYAAGNVSGGISVGGLVGRCGYAEVVNCVAANDSIISNTSTTNINRIVGEDMIGYNNSYKNNYAYSNVVVQNSKGKVAITDGLNTNAGMSKNRDTLRSFAFYNTASNWRTKAWNIVSDTAIWDICDGKTLPWLRWQGIDCDAIYIISITASTIITSGSNNGNIGLGLELPNNVLFTGNMLVSLPLGFTLDEANTLLSPDLANDLLLNITPQANNTWNISIEMQSSGIQKKQKTYQDILTLAYTVAASVPDGIYTAHIKNLTFKFTDGGIATETNIPINITVNRTTGITHYELRNTNYVIYPNPTTGKLTINCEDKGACPLVKVYDVVGQVVYTPPQPSKNTPPNLPKGEEQFPSFGGVRGGAVGGWVEVDISHLANGMYFLKIDNKMYKIIKN